jgi:hypothetical protein
MLLLTTCQTLSETLSIDNGLQASAIYSLILFVRSCLQPASFAASRGDSGEGHEPSCFDRSVLLPFRCPSPARLISQKRTHLWVGRWPT